jgi:transposase-like protein
MATMIEQAPGDAKPARISAAEGRLPKASPVDPQEWHLPEASPGEAGARGAALPGPQWSDGERSEAERNGGPGSADRGGDEGRVASHAADPEVLEKPRRRFFTAEYKRRILREADRCPKGQLGALLRREGLYSSHLTVWRRERDLAEAAALAPRKRGPKVAPPNPLAAENKQLRREKAALERRLRRAETILEIQKKASELLGIPLNTPEYDENE